MTPMRLKKAVTLASCTCVLALFSCAEARKMQAVSEPESSSKSEKTKNKEAAVVPVNASTLETAETEATVLKEPRKQNQNESNAAEEDKTLEREVPDRHPQSPIQNQGDRAAVDRAWDEAVRRDDVDGYTEFIRTYPKDERAHKAWERIEELYMEDARKRQAQEDDKTSVVDQAPPSIEEPQTEPTLPAETNTDSAPEPAKTPAKSQPPTPIPTKSREESDWDKTSRSNSVREIEEFIQSYPKSKHRKAAEGRIVDLEVEEIMNSSPTDLPPLDRVKDNADPKDNEVTVSNYTDHVLSIRFSGPESQKHDLPPDASYVFHLDNGTYKVTASVNSKQITHYARSETLTGGKYESEFYVISVTR